MLNKFKELGYEVTEDYENKCIILQKRYECCLKMIYIDLGSGNCEFAMKPSCYGFEMTPKEMNLLQILLYDYGIIDLL